MLDEALTMEPTDKARIIGWASVVVPALLLS